MAGKDSSSNKSEPYRLIPFVSGPCIRRGCRRSIANLDLDAHPDPDSWPHALQPIECYECEMLVCRSCENNRWRPVGGLSAALYAYLQAQYESGTPQYKWTCDNCAMANECPQQPRPLIHQLLAQGSLSLDELSSDLRHTLSHETIHSVTIMKDGELDSLSTDVLTRIRDYRADALAAAQEPDDEEAEDDDKEAESIYSDEETATGPAFTCPVPKRRTKRASRPSTPVESGAFFFPAQPAASAAPNLHGSSAASAANHKRGPDPAQQSEQERLMDIMGRAFARGLTSAHAAPNFSLTSVLGKSVSTKMEKFDGDPAKFIPWWTEFLRRVDADPKATLQDKVDALRLLLEGQAKEIVSHLSFGGATEELRLAAYNEAKRILETTYGNYRIQSQETWRIFNDLTKVAPGDHDGLQDLLIKLRLFGSRLRQAGEPEAVLDGVVQRCYALLPVDVAGKMTENVIRNLGFSFTEHRRETFAIFLQNLEREVHIANMTGLSRPLSHSNALPTPASSTPAPSQPKAGAQSQPRRQEQPKTEPPRPQPSKEPSKAKKPRFEREGRRNRCNFCSGLHSLFYCGLSLEEREKKRKEKKLCPNCLKDLHTRASECRYVNKKCPHDGKLHHPALCAKAISLSLARREQQLQSKAKPRSQANANPAGEPMEEEDAPELLPLTRQFHSLNVANPVLSHKTPHVLLCYFQATLVDRQGHKHPVGVYGDPGGTFSKIDRATAANAGLSVIYRTRVDEGRAGTRKRFVENVDRVGFNLLGKDGSLYYMDAFSVKDPAGNVVMEPHKLPKNILKQVGPLEDILNLPPKKPISGQINIIIGQDWFHLFFNKSTTIVPGLIMYSTVFGRVLSGCAHRSALQPSTFSPPFTTSLSAPAIKQWEEEQEEKDSAKPTMAVSLFTTATTTPPKEEDEDARAAHALLQELRTLDAVGLGSPSDEDPEQDPVWLQFKRGMVRKEDGSYEVELPLKTPLEALDIPTGFNTARNRLSVLLRSWPEAQKQSLQELFNKFEDMGILEAPPPGPSPYPTFYVPFFAVAKDSSPTTPLRPVVDGACKSAGGKSLNSFIWAGPNLLPDISGVIMRLKLAPKVLLADISKAFYTTGVAPRYRGLQRIILPENFSQLEADRFKIMQFTKMVMGYSSSPMGLNCVVRGHLDNVLNDASRPPEVTKEIVQHIKENIYVDNIFVPIMGETSLASTISAISWIFSTAKMPLADWASDLPELSTLVPDDKLNPKKEVSVLGLGWIPSTNATKLRAPNLDKLLAKKLTKRVAAGLVAAVFDVDGRMAPVLLRLRLQLYHSASLKDLKWGQELPELEQVAWEPLIADLKRFGELQFQRRLTDHLDVPARLVGYADASTHAYGCVVFFHQELPDAEINCKFLCGKSRVAPTGDSALTIPRLELVALALLSKVLGCAEMEMKLIRLLPSVLYTDSKCALAWCVGDQNLKPWHNTRVYKIRKQRHTDVRFVPTAINPADIASRGASMDELLESTYHSGPAYLQHKMEEWPDFEAPNCDAELLNGDEPLPKAKPSVAAADPAAEAAEDPDAAEDLEPEQQVPLPEQDEEEEEEPAVASLDPRHHKSVQSLLRATAYLRRAVAGFKGQPVPDHLSISVQEMREARAEWVRVIQKRYCQDELSAFERKKQTNRMRQLGLQLDSEGLIRTGSRLHRRPGHADPYFLPKQATKFVELLIRGGHRRLLCAGPKLLHAHIQAEYWIPALSQRIRSFYKRPEFCPRCSLTDGKAFRQPEMAQLPPERVTVTAPFQATGLDYFGPLKAVDPTTKSPRKFYAAVFTCPATRAVHLELVYDLTVESCLMAISRFHARRGIGKGGFLSDNGTYFLAAKSALSTFAAHSRCTEQQVEERFSAFLADRGIQWRTYPERAAFFGGFIERVVGLAKKHLRRVLWKKTINTQELLTLLCAVEQVLNSRPITGPSDDAKDGLPLRPECFLQPYNYTALELPTDEALETLRKEGVTGRRLASSIRVRRKLITSLIKRWEVEYLAELRSRFLATHKRVRGSKTWQPKPGNYYLLDTDGQPRGGWAFVRVNRLLYGSDNIARFAEVVLPSGKITRRAISRLIPFEAAIQEECNEPQLPPADPVPNSQNAHNGAPILVQAPTARALRAARRDATRPSQ